MRHHGGMVTAYDVKGTSVHNILRLKEKTMNRKRVPQRNIGIILITTLLCFLIACDVVEYTDDPETPSENTTPAAPPVTDIPLPSQCSGVCNSATPVYPTVTEDSGIGNVTMYTTEASNGGACNYGTTGVMYFAAMSVNVVPGDAKGQWQGGAICGQCVEVTAITSQGPQKVVVRIMDKCPDGDCGIDLGGAAPAEVMLDGFGRYDGSWQFVSCEGHPEVFDGPASLHVLEGSNQWWSRVHVRNGNTAVKTIAWETSSGNGGTFSRARDPENSYEVPQNDVLQSGASSIRITVTYTDGNTATVTLTPQELGASNTSYPFD